MTIRERRFLRVSRIAGFTVLAVGALATIGWVAHVPVLTGVSLGDTSVKPNTALAFLLCGIALLALHESWMPQRRIVASLCAIVVMLIGIATLIEYRLGWAIGIDEWIIPGTVSGDAVAIPTRMAFATGLCFGLVGAALLLMHNNWMRVGSVLAIASNALTLLMLLGTIMGADELFGDAIAAPMTTITAIALWLLGAGILFAAPSKGLAHVMLGEDVGGSMFRVTFPGIVLVPVILAALLIRGEHAGWFNLRTGIALYAFAIIAVSIARLVFASRWLNRIDAKRNASERRFAAMIGHSADVMALNDANAVIQYVSPSISTVLGYTAEEVIGRRPFEFIHPDDIAVATLVLQSIMVSPGTSRNLRVRQRHKNGNWLWTDVMSTNWLHEPGIAAIVTSFRDVTERKVAEEALVEINDRQELLISTRMQEMERTNRELEAFSYSVSHDLRTPLSRIHGFAHILLEDFSHFLDEEGNKFVRIIASNAQLMGTLMDHLLSFARLHKQEMDLTEIELTSLVRRAWAAVIDDRPGRAIDFSVDELPTITGDATMIMRMFVNLLSNAVKFTRGMPAAVVRVRAERTREALLIHVEDNGAGFRMEHAGKLFTIFQRLHPATEYDGLGIGLAFAQRYAERHGGSISCVGEPGNGATFTVRLPLSNS